MPATATKAVARRGTTTAATPKAPITRRTAKNVFATMPSSSSPSSPIEMRVSDDHRFVREFGHSTPTQGIRRQSSATAPRAALPMPATLRRANFWKALGAEGEAAALSAESELAPGCPCFFGRRSIHVLACFPGISGAAAACERIDPIHGVPGGAAQSNWRGESEGRRSAPSPTKASHEWERGVYDEKPDETDNCYGRTHLDLGAWRRIRGGDRRRCSSKPRMTHTHADAPPAANPMRGDDDNATQAGDQILFLYSH